MIPDIQRIFFYFVAGVILGSTINLSRTRRMRENFILLWLFISVMLVVLVVRFDLLIVVAGWLKANPSSLVMFCGMVALLLLILQLTVMNSSQATQIKNLAQKIALLTAKKRGKRK